jgi:LPXTG-motif cell wall-anchored protein
VLTTTPDGENTTTPPANLSGPGEASTPAGSSAGPYPMNSVGTLANTGFSAGLAFLLGLVLLATGLLVAVVVHRRRSIRRH